MFIDTHIHLDRLAPQQDPDAAVDEAVAAGIRRFVVPGVDRQGWQGIADLVNRMDWARAAYGLHPMAAEQWTADTGTALTTALRGPKVVAVGEIGLDRLIDVPLDVQEQAFRGQIQIAVAESLPILVHCRRMPGRMLEILREEDAGRTGGILHAYGGSWQTAKAAIDLGFALSFGGPLTYPEARRAIDVVRQAPADALVIETDAPDLPPHPHRDQPNRPVWLVLIARRLAEIRGWSLDRTAEVTTANARRILNLD